MATRTYTVGDQSGVRRLDNLTGPWLDIPLNLLDCKGNPILDILRDVMVDPNDENKVFVSGWRQVTDCRPGIYWSNDAGVTWNKAVGDIATIGPNLSQNIFEIWCVDSNIIYATSNFGYCFKSTDGGVTFNHTVANPDMPGLPAPQNEVYSRAIHFPDANNGVLNIDLNGGQTHIAITNDGGASWSKYDIQSVHTTMLTVWGIHMSVDYQTINVLAENGIWRSIDGGTSYDQVYTTTNFDRLLHLTWVGDNDLWGYGEEGLRIRSSDGGATWTTINAATSGAASCKAGHHYQLPEGFFSENANILQTLDKSVSGSLSETSVYGIEAVWTNTPGPTDPPNSPCGCPAGYTYNPATDNCEQTISVPPNCTGNELSVVPITINAQYSQMGTNFFASTAGSALPLTPITAVGGLGGIQDANSIPLSYTRVDASTNNFWGNCNPANPYPIPCSGSANVGRLNAIGVWSNLSGGAPHNEWIGFTTCIIVPETGTYFIGIGSDESSRFLIDGVLFANLFPGSFDEWSVWRVFPVLLTAGQHTIEMEGMNANGPGGFGAEIYKVPGDDINVLMNVSSEVELAPYIIWNTKQVADQGGFFDLGESSGCACPDGYALSDCNGFLECVFNDTVLFVPCGCYLLTNCEDAQDTVLIQTDPNDPPLNLSLTYVFNSIDPEKCWTVTESDLCDPVNPLPFSTFDKSFATCEDCLKVCYELTDCESLLTPKQTDTDLSAYVGQVVTLITCPETCWIVNELVDCPPVVEQVILDQTFLDCATCLPAPEPPAPLAIRNRKVKPGYDTPGCPPEYVEKTYCQFSEALFQEAASRRYGIEFCCEKLNDLDKLLIKKELLDLKMITDFEACKTIVDECCPPCGIETSIHVFQTITCLAPTNISAALDVPNPPVVPNCIEVTLNGVGGAGAGYPVTGTDCCGIAIDILVMLGQSITLCIDLNQPYSIDPNINAVFGPNCNCDPNPPFDCFCIVPFNAETIPGQVTANDCAGNAFTMDILPQVIYEPICVRADGLYTVSPNVQLQNLGPCDESSPCTSPPICEEVTFVNNSPDQQAIVKYTDCATGIMKSLLVNPGTTSHILCITQGSAVHPAWVTVNPTGSLC